MEICEKSRELGFIECLYNEGKLRESNAKRYISLIKQFKLEADKYILEYIKKEFPHLFRNKTKLKCYSQEELKNLLSKNKTFFLVKHLKGDLRKWYYTENLCEIFVCEHDYNKDWQVTMYHRGVRTLGNMGLNTFLEQLNKGFWLLNEKT